MSPRLLDAEYVRDFIVHLRFADGTEGDVDLTSELHGPVFQPLQDVEYFRTFTLNADLHTIIWPNGADFAPEFLYDLLTVPA